MMRNSLFVVLIGVIMMVIGVSIFVLLLNSKTEQTHSRVEYLKDSLEMEYIKKKLESYPYDHSEIKDTTVIK